jgi:pSer/pThr/pTyr-binding forkhead associated (FHA) protein
VLKLIIEDDEGRKTVVPFVRDELTVGRQEGNTIRLTERNVSRKHARLLRENGHVIIEDLGSYNGVKINGDRVTGQVKVKSGDLIQIGDYDLAIQSDDGAKTVPLDTARHLMSFGPGQDATATLPAFPAVHVSGKAKIDDVQEANPDDAHSLSDPPTPTEQHHRRVDTDETTAAGSAPTQSKAIHDLRPSEAPRLVALNTDLAGREFPCLRTELRIGRTDENDISLDHRSLSRTHCKLVRESSGDWRIIDLQSANGMRVNGEAYSQVTLHRGDEVHLGHVVLKFLMPGDDSPKLGNRIYAPPSSTDVDEVTDLRRATRSRAPALAMISAILVILVGVGGYFGWKRTQASNGGAIADGMRRDADPRTPPQPHTAPNDDPADAPSAPGAEAQRKAIAAKILAARTAMAEADWEHAQRLLNECVVAGALTAEAQAGLSELDQEKANKAALDEAATWLATGKLDRARTELDSAKSTRLFKARLAELEELRGKLASVKVAETQKKPPTITEIKIPSKTRDAENLFKEAQDLIKRQELQAAKFRLERCIKLAPNYHPCYRSLGSTQAKIAARDRNPAEMEKAREYYEKYLEVAPADDEYVPKVQKILEQARNQ